MRLLPARRELVTHNEVARAVKRSRWRWRLLLIAGLVTLASSGYFPWYLVYHSTTDIDIFSGRMRCSDFLFCLPVRRTTWNSSISETLPLEEQALLPVEWHTIRTSVLGSTNSPHYAFHLAEHQTLVAKAVWDKRGFDSLERRTSARTILQLWQRTQSYHAAETYLDGLRLARK